ncbi:hypothetical protein KOW79_017722 [Hemibagrus wyckioides]|uniref:Uncharacterized protein n=1 Tax=Hemibagrus wyckioides TaxID=337641 RepID=A0A9D3SH29_9TELE|nr:hypothetical protein KOW79_017722 [Hemibagrus wyckioides]
MAFKPNEAKTFTQSRVRREEGDFPGTLLGTHAGSCNLFTLLPSSPRGEGKNAGLFRSGSVKEKMEAADGTRRPMMMKVMKFGILVCDENSLSTPASGREHPRNKECEGSGA